MELKKGKDYSLTDLIGARDRIQQHNVARTDMKSELM